MRAVLQRVSSASVRVDGRVVGEIGPGLLILLGIEQRDKETDADYLVNKVAGLRIFEDTEGRMNRSVMEVGGSLLVVSQFTLYGDTRKGRRPSYGRAARPEQAEPLYKYFIQKARELGVTVAEGIFQAQMSVSLVNEGPVTLLCDSAKIITAGEPS